MKKISYAVLVFSFFPMAILRAEEPIKTYSGQTIWDLRTIEEHNIDLGLWCLVIEKEVFPELDIPKYLEKIDKLANNANKVLIDRSRDFYLIQAVNALLHKSGPWNNFEPVTYNLEDPLANQLKTSCLWYFLETKKGNCVSMPLLLLSVVGRANHKISFFGSRAPQHFFCILDDRKTGLRHFFEATNGFDESREWMITRNHIPSSGIEKNWYMSTLSKKELLSMLIDELAIKTMLHFDNYTKSIQYLYLALEIDPCNASAYRSISIMLALESQRFTSEIVRAGRKPNQGELIVLNHFNSQSAKLMAWAKKIGYSEVPEEQRRAYMNEMNQLRARSGQSFD